MQVTIEGKLVDVPDEAVDAALKAHGRRLVEDKDYIRAKEAAAELQKFRLATGEGRSLEEIVNAIKFQEEAQKKDKTAAELLKMEFDKLNQRFQQAEQEKAQMAQEVKKRDIRDYFNSAMEKEQIRIIGPILEGVMAPFYGRPVDPTQKAQFDLDVKAALVQAQEMQNAELARLGLGGARTDEAGFGGGGVTVTRNSGIPLGSPNDMDAILRETSALPSGIPFGTPGQGR